VSWERILADSSRRFAFTGGRGTISLYDISGGRVRMPTLDKTYPQRRTAGPARLLLRRDTPRAATLPDVRREPVGNFLGRVDPDDPVGGFGNVSRPRRRGAGAFAGDPDRRRQGSFSDHDLGRAA
jgi:hypothetical protein